MFVCCLLCLWFYVGVQCVIVVFDVLCVGDLGTIFVKKASLDDWRG